MPINYPGPFEVRLKYVTNEPDAIKNHELRLSCEMGTEGAPGSAFTAWFPKIKDGTFTVDLSARCDSLLTWLRPHWSAAVTFVAFELWEYAPLSFDSVFRAVKTSGLVGSAGGATVQLSQSILTMRTTGGGIMKVDMRGTIYAANPFTSPTAPAPSADLLTYMLGNTAPWRGRDGTFPAAGLKWLPGSNERAFKKVNR